MRLRRVGIVIKPDPRRAPEILEGLRAWLQRRGIDQMLDRQTSARGAARTPRQASGPAPERAAMARRCDLIISVGGDGTLLSVARDMAGAKTPILGVNLGSLGFLTEIPLEDLYGALEGILAGRHAIQPRMRLHVEILRRGRVVSRHEVLNEVVVNKAALARVLDITVNLDGRFMNSFQADGMIVCTPTGSTAYSLSAGGPIVVPSVDATILCPICPHTLSNRPIVTPDTSRVELRLARHRGDVYVTLDGQVGAPLREGDHVAIRKSKNPVRMVRFPDKDYFEVLRQKLKWGGRGPRPGRAGAAG